MLLSAELEAKDNNVEVRLPVNYRHGFIHIIKSAVNKFSPKDFKVLFERQVAKPYTFSVYLGKNTKVEEGGLTIRASQNIIFNFSTMYDIFLIWIYNFLMEKREVNLFSVPFTVKRISVRRHAYINRDSATFRTLSPILIRDNKRESFYLCPKCDNFRGDENFHDSLIFNIRQEIRSTTKEINESLADSVELIPISCRRILIKDKVKRADGSEYLLKMPGIVGKVQIKADKKILNLVNQIGIGSRRGQGFGMIEYVTSN